LSQARFASSYLFVFPFNLLPFALLTLILLSVAAAASFAEDGAEETAAANVQATNLHQWGAVTLFHGLPSDRVRAIAQDADGVMWFGTDAGLARYDGRRTQTVAEGGLAGKRVHALRFDDDGALWIGTETGAVVRSASSGEYRRISETEGKAITAITPAPNVARGDDGSRVLMTSNAHAIFDCRLRADASLDVRTVEDKLLRGVSAPEGRAATETENRSPLELTSLTVTDETLYVGTRGRGFLAVEAGAAREVFSRPRPYFVETVERDAHGRMWFGVQTTSADSGLYESDARFERPVKVLAGATGTVTALRFDAQNDLYVGTDGQGVFRYRGRVRLERFTFAGTRGGLRSDRIYSIFVDREGVAWFGTDRGVCRYDPKGLRNESLSEERESNLTRVLFQTTSGRLLAGGNGGLYVREATSATTAAWRAIEDLNGKVVYAVAEDDAGSLLVGTSSGLHVRAQPSQQTQAAANLTADANSAEPEHKPETGTLKDRASSNTRGARQSPSQASEPVVGGNIRAIVTFQGATYIAVFGRGLERLERTEGRLRSVLVWPTDNSDARRRDIVSLHVDESGRMWMATVGAGVFVFDGKQVATEPALEALRTHAVRAVSGGGKEPLWIATSRGLYVYRGGNALTEVVPNIDARAVVNIRPDAQRDAGDVEARAAARAWCATAGGGLLKVSVDELFGAMVARLDVEQGLPSQSVFAVLPLEERQETPDAASAANVETTSNANDVETGNEANLTEALWIATSRGVSRYEPGRVRPALRPTRITGARAHHTDELKGGLRLEYPQNSLVLDVTATSSRTFPEQFQYAFLLSDGAGKVLKRKLAHDAQFLMENLAPGKYRVEARAFTGDLVPSDSLAFELYVARAPFPWTTTALSVLLALAIVALLWGSVQNARLTRTGKALLEANSQLAAARLQLANETETERRRIARDLHDQTLADLRRLLLMTDELPASSSAAGANGHAETIDPVVLRGEIESISNEIRRICEDLSPSVLENVGFAAALEFALAERVAHLPADCRFAYEFVCDDELEERWRLSRGVQMQIYRIVQEAVSNICRHAAATRVRLKVDVTETDDFVLTLEDDGRGFDPENRRARKGRGLANIRARASIIEADVRWRRRDDGDGTVFVLHKDLKNPPATS
jgi:signal transduction histidine kinase/ligand-binding sensor domain-containing protein